jgi:predicted ester cyclase
VSSEAEENKALVRRFLAAEFKWDAETIDKILAPDFVDHSLLGEPGPKGYLRAMADGRAPFSEFHHNIEDQVAEGDKVVTRITGRATHDRREAMGVAPTGEEYEGSGIIIHRVVGGKIAEQWREWSGGSLLMGLRLEEEVRQRERIEQDLRVARRIQQASLPMAVPTLEGWAISPLYQPAREVGGDFYDFHLLSEGKLGLVVGDATGKGVPAALVMSTTRGMLQAVSQASDPSSPGEVLRQVNDALRARIPSNTFVTCFYAILDPESGSLSYANAGHDLPYLRRNSDAKELRARGMPLGLMPGMSYEESEVVIGPGECVLFYSDGLVEAHDPKGEMFGFSRLRELVAEHGEERSLGDLLLELVAMQLGCPAS